MNIKELIEKLISSNVLVTDLVELPGSGVTEEQIAQANSRLGKQLNSDLAALLRVCDGANLEVIRFHSLSNIELSEYGLFFANDPAGFTYHIASTGEIFSESTDGGEITLVATSVNEFIFSYLFGRRSAEFGGQEWHKELIAAGVAT
jgi:hypothetical protein